MPCSAPSPGIESTATSADPVRIQPTILAATRLEARAIRRELPGARVVVGGIGLSRTRGGDLGAVVVSCGLAGTLRPELGTGSVLVPHAVLRPDGTLRTCDAELVEALEDAARRLGYRPECAPLLTHTSLVTGEARRTWMLRGCAGVDMETGLIDAPRVAAVRVVLDGPGRELSSAWLRPAAARLLSSAWLDLPWLWREAPRCARLAARVLAAALRRA